MKNKIIIIFTVALLFLSACSSNVTTSKEENSKLKVVTTIFPQYDFTREIGQENVDVKMLLKPGAESHSYEPTPQDIRDIQNADLFIYVGGENDVWVESILQSFKDKKPTTIRLIDTVTTVNEEIVEGMEHSHDGHNHEEHKHQEIHEEDIKDRNLEDFIGKFTSLTTHIEKGILDEAIKEHALEHGEEEAEVKEEIMATLKTQYNDIEVKEESIILNNEEIKLSYEGFKTLKNDENEIESVWYIFKTNSIPQYVAFNDHGIGNDQEHDEEHHDEAKHLHVVYLNNISELETLKNIPFYVDANASDEEVAALMSHDHSHEEAEIDEHVWTSPVNAMEIVKAISTVLIEKDPANAEFFKANTETYLSKLEDLDKQFKDVVANAENKTLMFGDRFPFRYFADEYGLNYYAAFSGCSTDTEATAQTVAFLIDKTKEENLPVVFSIELSNGKIADSIAEATSAKRLTLYSCHNITKDQLENGTTYLSMMQENVESLKEALK